MMNDPQQAVNFLATSRTGLQLSRPADNLRMLKEFRELAVKGTVIDLGLRGGKRSGASAHLRQPIQHDRDGKTLITRIRHKKPGTVSTDRVRIAQVRAFPAADASVDKDPR